MKGQLLELALIGVAFTVASFLVIIIPFVFTRIQFVETIDAETVQNNAQLILLSLLSSTYQNKPIYQVLVEHEVSNQYPNIEQILTPRIFGGFQSFTPHRRSIRLNGNSNDFSWFLNMAIDMEEELMLLLWRISHIRILSQSLARLLL